MLRIRIEKSEVSLRVVEQRKSVSEAEIQSLVLSLDETVRLNRRMRSRELDETSVFRSFECWS